MYLFPEFFEGKATEHLLGQGIEASHLNDDKIGSRMDKLYKKGVSSLFLLIALAVFKKYEISTIALHKE
ncbi:MAG: DUF4277 domain-containing protein [Symploca sp. SIO1C4]|uniref:DUF4277 domain-containing protein n=1 Tax=Symploca sp. SIO1C4 TaxID=2607765 RepID=A0A6B3NR23_9CYAN|nr:DUF4277 domain-containing protein [Symploca sp. SIO1C4]NET05386.1 DUF4277 domain-containing protein [Symploca sp. SIO2B6]